MRSGKILTQARAEHGALAMPAPPGLTIKIDGDLRYRHQADRPSKDNTPPLCTWARKVPTTTASAVRLTCRLNNSGYAT